MDPDTASVRLRRLTRSRAFAPILIGLLGIVVTGVNVWVPAPWYDEAATISAAERSIPQLLTMLQTVDAVHGLYYAFMHFWFGAFGYSPLLLRLPSVLAAGLACAALVVLVRRIAAPQTAVVAGLLLVLLPRLTYAATEGRSYAMQILMAVSLTLVFTVALSWSARDRTQRTLIWIAYGLLALLSCTLFIYMALLVVAQGIALAVLAIAEWRRNPVGARRSVLGWLIAAVATALVLLPLVLLDVSQRQQVSWISPVGPWTTKRVFQVQWFLGADWFARLAWTAVALAVVILVVQAIRRRRPRVERVTGGPAIAAAPLLAARGLQPVAVLAITIPSVVIPTAALIIGSLTVVPMYSERYLTFTSPGIAILMAVTFTVTRRWWVAGLAVLLSAVLVFPSWKSERGVNAKPNPSNSAIAAFIGAERAAEPAGQRDAILYGPLHHEVGTDMGILAYTYPSDFAGLNDLQRSTPAAETGALFRVPASLDVARTRLHHEKVIWLITQYGPYASLITNEVDSWGYHLDRQWNFSDAKVVRYVIDTRP